MGYPVWSTENTSRPPNQKRTKLILPNNKRQGKGTDDQSVKQQGCKVS
jgi:hypothetical protein